MSRWKEDWKYSVLSSPNSTPSQVSMKRGLKAYAVIYEPSSFSRSRWKEDWKETMATSSWPHRTPSRWKEDWKLTGFIIQGGSNLMSRWKEDWKRYSMSLYFHPWVLVSMKRGLKGVVGERGVGKSWLVSMKRGLKDILFPLPLWFPEVVSMKRGLKAIHHQANPPVGI